MTRPGTLVFVSGTGTDIGKTWWSAEVARALVAVGTTVAIRKPVQSGAAGTLTDADRLGAASGEDPAVVCPPGRTYPLAWAPPMAAAELGLAAFTTADLAAETTWPASVAVGLVEGVGGPRSPISADGDSVDLARALRPDLVVVVADAGLGTINAVRLSVAAFAGPPVVVALNRYRDEPLHHRNHDVLTTGDGFDVVTSPEELATRLR
jgi:dethiobiotin synthetase